MCWNKEKTHEYREAKPFWISRIKDQQDLILVAGYGKDNFPNLKAKIKDISIIPFDKLPEYARIEFYGSDYDNFFDIEFEVIEGKNDDDR